jgi:mRNA interferase RelE/StbE
MLAPFEGKYSSKFLADLKKLDPPVQRRIVDAIEAKLLRDPFGRGKKLVSKTGPGQWRFRVGDYRVRFDIEGRTVFFYRVRHRREIYE